MAEDTDDIAKKMMAGTAYESIELEDVDMDEPKKQAEKQPEKKTEIPVPTREYTDEEKSRFAQILRAKYSDRSMSDYIECQEYLESKKKHLANAKQAQEKLRSQALTYMQSIMDSEKRKTLPKDILRDVAVNGNKFVEKFGYDADGATNPVTMKFRDWMDRNKDNLQKLQNAVEATAEKTAGKAGSTAKKSVLGALWEEKESIKVSAFLMGFGGACLGALAGGPQGAVLGGVGGAVAGAGLVSTIIGVETNKANRKAQKAAKTQENTKQNQRQQEKTKTKESKVDWNEVGFWGKMVAGCSAIGAGIGGFMAYTAAHATAAGVAGSAAAITTSITTGAIVGALAVPAMVATYKIGTWLKEKAGNIADKMKAKKQERAMQKQAEKAKNKTKAAEKTKLFDKDAFMDKLQTIGFVAGLSGLVGAGAAVIGQAYPAGAGISIPVWAGAAAAMGLGATAVAAGAYKIGSWVKSKFGKVEEQSHVKAMEAQDLSKAKEQTEHKVREVELNKKKEVEKPKNNRGYKGKITDNSLKKKREDVRSA